MSETTAPPPPGWPPPAETGDEAPGQAAPSYPPPHWAPPAAVPSPPPPYGGAWHWGPPGGPPPHGPGWGPSGPGGRPPRTGRKAAVAVMIGAAVLAAALLGGVVGHGLSSSQGPASAFVPGTNPSTSPPQGAPANAAAIAASVSPGLVDVNTVLSTEGIQGAGTGMVLTSNGEVLTNNHVVEGANRISVTDIGNGKTYDATVVGYDRSHDVAVLQLSGASGLTTVNVGNSSTVTIGQGVVAMGNANGTGGTPSYAGGTITATNQSITASDQVSGSSEQLTGLLQTDANIVEGDSGGPLVNSSAKVIGMDTAASSSFQFSNTGTQGYAIPINTALNIAKQIESGQSSNTVHIGPTAFMGVGVRDAGSGGGSPFGGGSSTVPGAQIVQLVPGGPAAGAGLSIGDVITSLAGQKVTSATDLTNIVITLKPGERVSVGFVNTSGQNQTVQMTLASGPAQ